MLSVFLVLMLVSPAEADALSQADKLSVQCELAIRNGKILDGAGNPWFRGDVEVGGGKIIHVGEPNNQCDREIDAVGKHVSPGWIDMMDQSGDVLLKNGRAENKLLMGVTSAIAGESGTAVPVEELPEYFATLEQQGISLNFGTYYAARQARGAVVGENDVAVTEPQIEIMKTKVAAAMKAGAFGITTALLYPPDSYMSTAELVELSKVVSWYGGLYASHIRDEGRGLIASVQEAIKIGSQAKVPVEIFHLKAAYQPKWNVDAHKVVELVNAARADGVDVAADVYPYVAAGTGIEATLPASVFSSGYEQGYARMQDDDFRAGIKAVLGQDWAEQNLVRGSGGWANVVLANSHNDKYRKFHGQSFEEIGSALSKDPADAAWDIMLEALPERAMALYFMMHEADVSLFIQQPWASIGSDASAALVLGEIDDLGLPHPRSYGTFPRVLSHYVRDQGVVSLEEAIRKMTSFPASRLGLKGRGLIREGMWADLVVFDEQAIEDLATWKDAMRTPAGIDYVVVNGVPVVEQGAHTGATPGQVLYGRGRARD